MILEMVTLFMFVLVLVLKYGVVTRLMRLTQKLREAEGRCRKQREILRVHRNERQVARREEEALNRRRSALVEELRRVSTALDAIKQDNAEMVQELLRRNARLDPELTNQDDEQD